MSRQSARSGLRPDQKPPDLSPAMGNYSCRQRGSLRVITRRSLNFQVHLPSVPGTIEVFEENRNIMVNAGVFSDEIGPYAVHVYGPF